jgi:hyperosmotically inducible protein
MKFAYITSVLIAMLAFGSMACNNRSDEANAQQLPAAEKADRTDTAITSEIKMKITDDELLDGSDIEVDTENGIVKLNGTVTNQAQLDRAAEIARNVNGVRTVDVFIDVNPGRVGDADLDDNNDVADDIDADGAAERTGEKAQELADKAQQAVGDAAVTTAVKMRLAGDDLVDANDIDVDTKEGVVTLNGVVDSQREAERAIQLARMADGVKEVKSNLTVNQQ